MPKRQQWEEAEELGGWDSAPPSAPSLCQLQCQHSLSVLSGLILRGRFTLQSGIGSCYSLPSSQNICPASHRRGAELYLRR